MSCPFRNTSFCVKSSLRPDPSVGTSITLYGETFTWTDQHISPSELNEWRKVGDNIVDEFFQEWGQELKHDVNIYNFVQKHLPDFVQSIRQRPLWFNKEQSQPGQHFFLKHLSPALLSLLYYVLLYGYGFQQFNVVLSKTRYLSSPDLQSSYRRIVETLQMIVNISCGNVDDFDQTFSDVVRVRFLHGIVRYKLHTNSKDVPINQEDLLATLMGFSFVMIHCMEDRMKINLSIEEKESYLHLWRYVGWLMGIEEKYLKYMCSYSAVKITFQSIFYHHYFPTTTSKHFAHHTLMAVYLYSPKPLSYRFHMAISQQLMEAGLLESLGLHEPIVDDALHLLARSLLLQVSKFTGWLWTYFPILSKFIINYNKKKLKEMISLGLNGKSHDFALKSKYDPSTAREPSLKNCPCGYYTKKQKTIGTMDFGILRGTNTAALSSWQLILFCLFIFLTIGWWVLIS